MQKLCLVTIVQIGNEFKDVMFLGLIIGYFSILHLYIVEVT